MSNELPAPQGTDLAAPPQQARDEAVQALISAGMSRAGMLQLSGDESKALMAPFPDEDFQAGAGGNPELIYIEHAALRNRLNSVLGLGQWTLVVRETRTEKFNTSKGSGIRVYVRLTMIIRGSQVGDSIGDMAYYPTNAKQNYGDAWEGAKTAAFRRCAKEFGIGLQAWQRDWCAGWWARKGSKPQPAQGRPAVAQQAPPVDSADDYPRDEDLDMGPTIGADEPMQPAARAASDPNQGGPAPSEPFCYEKITLKMVKAPVGKGPAKLYAMDGKTIFTLWPKSKSGNNPEYTKFQAAWNPPSNVKQYRIEGLREDTGEHVNLNVLVIDAVKK